MHGRAARPAGTRVEALTARYLRDSQRCRGVRARTPAHPADVAKASVTTSEDVVDNASDTWTDLLVATKSQLEGVQRHLRRHTPPRPDDKAVLKDLDRAPANLDFVLSALRLHAADS